LALGAIVFFASSRRARSSIDHPRHQEDARVLRLVLERRRRRE